MAPHQERVIKEREELHDKIVKLDAFRRSETFKSLVIEDRDLLLEQFDAMLRYQVILDQRIFRFKQ